MAKFMKSFNVKVTVLALLSIVGGVVAWYGFALPRNPHSTRESVVKTAKKQVTAPQEKKEQEFVPLQIQVLPWHKAFVADKEKSIRGFGVGYYLQQKEINGFIVAFIHAANQRKSGFSLSVIEFCGESSGLSMFLYGGSVSNNGCAVALWNLSEKNNGVQIGVVNQSRQNALTGLDLKSPEKADGFGVQAGLVNYSDGRGIQFGLWNTNPNGFLKHFPLINFSF